MVTDLSHTQGTRLALLSWVATSRLRNAINHREVLLDEVCVFETVSGLVLV
jgi:hypothetical protein